MVTPAPQPPPAQGQVPDGRLLRARRQGRRLCELLRTAPPGLREDIEAGLAARLVRKLRDAARQALLVGHVLQPMTSSSSSSRPVPLAGAAAFADTLVACNCGIVDELLAAAGRYDLGTVAWPATESHLLRLAPELRQLTTWILTLGSDESLDDSSQATMSQEAVEPDGDGPEIVQIIAPVSAETGAPAAGRDGDGGPGPAPSKEALDEDDAAFVQTTMTLGSSSDEEPDTVTVETVASNLEQPRDEDTLFARVHDTLAEQWERGEEALVVLVARRLYQLGSQMEATPVHGHVYHNMACLVRSYAEVRGYSGPVPSPAWQSWTADVELNLRQLFLRGRDQARHDINLNFGQARLHPNANMNPADLHQEVDHVDLMARHQVTKKRNRPGPHRRHKAKKSIDKPAPGGPGAGRSTEDWVTTERPASRTMPHTRWLLRPPPWRHSAQGIRRRGRDRHARASTNGTSAPAGGHPACRPPATTASSRESWPAPRPVRSTRPPTAGIAAPPLETADAAAAPAGDNDTEPLDPFLAERAAAFWREQLGMLEDDEVDPDAQDGGLLPNQRQRLVRSLAALNAADRARVVPWLAYFMATLVQDVSATVAAATDIIARYPPLEAVAATASGAVDDAPGAALPAEVGGTAEQSESEDQADADDPVLVQTTCKRARLEYSPTALLLETVDGALRSLGPLHQRMAADLVLQVLRDYDDALAEVRLFLQLFQAYAGSPSTRSLQPTTTPPTVVEWVHTWTAVLRGHLQHAMRAVVDPAPGVPAEPGDEAAVAVSSTVPPPTALHCDYVDEPETSPSVAASTTPGRPSMTTSQRVSAVAMTAPAPGLP